MEQGDAQMEACATLQHRGMKQGRFARASTLQ